MGLSNLDRSQVTSIGDAQRAPHALAGAAVGTRSCLAAPLKLWDGRATGIVGFASAQRLRCANALKTLREGLFRGSCTVSSARGTARAPAASCQQGVQDSTQTSEGLQASLAPHMDAASDLVHVRHAWNPVAAAACMCSLSEAHSQLIMNFASIAAHEIETDQRLASQLKPHSTENGDKPQAAGNSFTLCMGVGLLTSYNMHAQLLAGSCVLLIDTRDAEWPVLYATSGWRALTGAGDVRGEGRLAVVVMAVHCVSVAQFED